MYPDSWVSQRDAEGNESPGKGQRGQGRGRRTRSSVPGRVVEGSDWGGGEEREGV